MAIANPAEGSSLREAATAIESALEEPPKESQEEPTESAQTEEKEPEANQPEPQVDVEEAETEAGELSLEQLPDTLEDFAAAMGLEADDLAGHLQIPVTVDGETRLVKLSEARKGYQLEADYRNKTAELSEQRRVLDEAAQQAVAEWQSRFESLHHLTQQLEETALGPKDLLQILEQEGPERYHEAKAQADVRQAALEEARRQQKEMSEKLAQDQQRQHETMLRQERERLLLAMPELADTKRSEAFTADIQSYLTSMGYKPEEMAQIYDHRHYRVLKDAMAYRALKKGKPEIKKQLKSLPKVMKPGARPEKADVKAQRTGALMKRLQKSGHRRDAAAVIKELL